MAGAELSFPKIASANWWALREQFKKKVPATVGPSYLSSVLGEMSDSSAKSNLITPLRKVGLLDDEGRPTDLAFDWRDDDKYPAVCKKILESCYPEEVRDIFDSVDCDIGKLKSWFMNHVRCGEPAAKMFSRFYLILLEADPSNSSDKKQSSKSTSNTKPVSKAAKAAKASSKASSTVPQDRSLTSKIPTDQSAEVSQTETHTHSSIHSKKAPQLHINIQLHISPDSSAEQIEKIFESMAKHLKDFN